MKTTARRISYTHVSSHKRTPQLRWLLRRAPTLGDRPRSLTGPTETSRTSSGHTLPRLRLQGQNRFAQRQASHGYGHMAELEQGAVVT